MHFLLVIGCIFMIYIFSLWLPVGTGPANWHLLLFVLHGLDAWCSCHAWWFMRSAMHTMQLACGWVAPAGCPLCPAGRGNETSLPPALHLNFSTDLLTGKRKTTWKTLKVLRADPDWIFRFIAWLRCSSAVCVPASIHARPLLKFPPPSESLHDQRLLQQTSVVVPTPRCLTRWLLMFSTRLPLLNQRFPKKCFRMLYFFDRPWDWKLHAILVCVSQTVAALFSDPTPVQYCTATANIGS